MSTPVPADHPDWSRERKRFFQWLPSRSLLASIRAYQRVRGSRRPDHRVRSALAVVRHRFWSVVTGADIPLNCTIGGGLLLPHPNGVVVHPDAVIGPNCLLFQQVTIGMRNGGAPRLGGHVDVGAGAKVLGPVSVGDDAQIGANAVVVDDVTAGDTVIGIPARSLRARGVAGAGPRPSAPLDLHALASSADVDAGRVSPASMPARSFATSKH